MSAPTLETIQTPATPWYAEVTRYQWLVLAIASAGWMFDAFEGQIFNLTRGDLLRELLGTVDSHRVKLWGDVIIAIFLLGGMIGGIGFGKLADRYGRRPAMAVTILFYAIFSGLTYFATHIWQVAALRFFVALGVGGEWAVGASLVAEVFPAKARARAGGIFHAISVPGTLLATAVGIIVATHWRYAYVIGILPALLVFWVMASVREPERWKQAVAARKPMGSLRELFGTRTLARHAIFGLLLAAVGLGTFWGVVVAGQDLAHEMLLRTGHDPASADRAAKFAYGIVETCGMGIGLLAFGPLAEKLGRRGAFLLMHLAAVCVVPIVCYLPQSYWQLLLLLPIFGFFTGGMHSGYAIYFPELFPNDLRATGAGVCFNGGRLIAAPILFGSGLLKEHMDVRLAITILSSLYLVGAFLLLFLPETKNKPLPE